MDRTGTAPRRRVYGDLQAVKEVALHMDIGTFLVILAFSYGIGVFWYDLLPGQLSSQVWRAAAYPFAAIVIAEAVVPYGPTVGGMHITSAVIAALIAVIVDWIITTYRQPSMVSAPELRTHVAAPTTPNL
jgi:hypothetical protein